MIDMSEHFGRTGFMLGKNNMSEQLPCRNTFQLRSQYVGRTLNSLQNTFHVGQEQYCRNSLHVGTHSMPGRNIISEHFVHVGWEQYVGIFYMSEHLSPQVRRVWQDGFHACRVGTICRSSLHVRTVFMSDRNNMPAHFACRLATHCRNTFHAGQDQYFGIVYMLEHFLCQARGICQNSQHVGTLFTLGRTTLVEHLEHCLNTLCILGGNNLLEQFTCWNTCPVGSEHYVRTLCMLVSNMLSKHLA